MELSVGESLLQRNEKLARECSRLKVENRSLKILVRRLLTEELRLAENKQEKSVQTDGAVLSAIKEVHRASLSTVHPNVSLDEWLRSPPSPGRGGGNKWASPRRSPAAEQGKENPSPPTPNTYLSPMRVRAPPPRLQPAVDAKVVTPAPAATPTIAPRTPTPLRSPLNAAGPRSSPPALHSPGTEARKLPQVPASSLRDREPRSVSRVVSYKEPSLTQKVRKGFKFFHFLNDGDK